MKGGGKVGTGIKTPPAAGIMSVQSQSVLQRQVGAAVDSFNWPPLASRAWVPLQALAPVSSPAGGRDDGVDAETGVTEASPGAGGKRLKILTWNVLCDGLSGAHPQRGGFTMAPEGSLDWDKRRWKLLEEILRWDCDVLLLQEVDHHHDWLSPMLAQQGYRSLFVKKPVAPGISFNPHLEDGCSLFYRVTTPAADGGIETTTTMATLDLLDAHTFTLAVVEQDETAEDEDGAGATGGDSGEGHKQTARPVAGNQVAVISLLSVSSADGGEHRGEGEDLVIVTTTHLKAMKDGHGEMIRARQAKQLLDEVARFRAGHERARGLPAGSIPLIVAGDFNATPHSFGGYEPLCYKQVTAHPLALQSALPISDDFFTTWKIRPAKPPAPEGVLKESKHCIDYVWVSSGVQPTRRSTLPLGEELGPTRAPSFAYPSDHFAIAVDLRLP